ncbi:MAG: prepilin-type N-terminal cleavage/methylation domain-containing protein, partial [Planctomycetota bacterium]
MPSPHGPSRVSIGARRRGASLVEMLVVIAVVGLLMGLLW